MNERTQYMSMIRRVCAVINNMIILSCKENFIFTRARVEEAGPARERIARSTEAVSVLQPLVQLRERRHLPEGEGNETKEGVSESAISTALSVRKLAPPSARNFSHAAPLPTFSGNADT